MTASMTGLSFLYEINESVDSFSINERNRFNKIMYFYFVVTYNIYNFLFVKE
jgi:hypothetical protein